MATEDVLDSGAPAAGQHSDEPETKRRKFTPRQRKAVIAGAVGNMVEFVDWAIYATFAPIFAAQFFAPGNPTAALLSTLAVYAAGFVMRPIGAALLGIYADRHGRKNGLVLTVGLMSGASAVIAIAPTYAQVGILAPLLLLLARLIQGFSAGGEFGSSVAFIVESAAPGRRAFAGSWQQVSVGVGTLFAAGMGALLTGVLDEHALQSWGWRLAFGVGAVLGLVVLWLRVSVSETEAFAKATKRPGPRRNALTAVVRDHPRAALRVAGMTVLPGVAFFMWVSYMPAYAHLTTGFPLREALLANTIALCIYVIAVPFGGLLADRVGRKPALITFAAGFVVFTWPALHFVGNSFAGLLVIEIIGMLLIAGYTGTCAAVMAEQFPAEVRTTGIGLPYAVSIALFGGTVPYVVTWMNSSGLGGLVWLYITIAAAISLVVYATMPETKGRVLT